MTSKNDLTEAAAELAETTERLTRRRDDMIRELLAAGERPVDVARAARLSRVRVYQIKDGHR